MGMTERVKDGTWKGIFGYKDESGGLMKDETNGLWMMGGMGGRKDGMRVMILRTMMSRMSVMRLRKSQRRRKDLRITIRSRRRWTHMWAKER
jgi:hypothetical protein